MFIGDTAEATTTEKYLIRTEIPNTSAKEFTVKYYYQDGSETVAAAAVSNSSNGY